MMELSVLVILIIVLGIGLFIIISKVASTPEPEDDLEEMEDDVFETASERESIPEEDHEEKESPSEEEPSEESPSKFVLFIGSFKTFMIQWGHIILKAVKRFNSFIRTGLTRIVHYMSSLFRLVQEKIRAFIQQISEHKEDHSSTSSHSENQEAKTTQESDDVDTSFLEEPTQQQRSFSTFESDFESFDETEDQESQEQTFSEKQSSKERSASRPSHTSSDEKVDTFVQSMLETEDDAVSHTTAVHDSEDLSLEQQESSLSQSTSETDQSLSLSQTDANSQVQQSEEHTAQEMETDHLRKLEQKYLKMIVDDPKNVDSYRRLGNLYLAMENYTDARETFRHILRLKKDDQRAQDKLQEIERIVKQNQNL